MNQKEKARELGVHRLKIILIFSLSFDGSSSMNRMIIICDKDAILY